MRSFARIIRSMRVWMRARAIARIKRKGLNIYQKDKLSILKIVYSQSPFQGGGEAKDAVTDVTKLPTLIINYKTGKSQNNSNIVYRELINIY